MLLSNPALRARIPEWRTLLKAAKHYQTYLDTIVPPDPDSDEEPLAYDDSERLDRVIPILEDRLAEHIQQVIAKS